MPGRVDVEIVNHDDIAKPQVEHRHLIDIGLQGDAIDLSVNHGCHRATVAQASNQGRRLPMARAGWAVAAARRAVPATLVKAQVPSMNTCLREAQGHAAHGRHADHRRSLVRHR